MKHSKRILSLFLALLLVTGCLSGLTLTAGATDYNLYIGGTRVTSDNQNDVLGDGGGGTGSVSYDPDTGTLTLNNAVLTATDGVGAFIDDDLSTWNSALTIELVGNSTIDGTAAGTAARYGIRSSGRLNIRGGGSLTISGVRWNGIEAQTLYFDDPDDADRPTVTVTTDRYGILARNITILNAEIHATTTGTERNDSSAYQKCEAAGIVAYNVSTPSAGFIKIGEGSAALHENNVVIDAHCQVTAYACYAIASSGYFDVTSRTTITTPADGSFVSGWGGAQTVKSGAYNALDVGITATPFSDDYAEYPLWVDGVTVTTWNRDDVLGDGTVSYDAENNVLALNNAAVTGAYDRACVKYSGSGSGDVLTVALTGASTVGSAGADPYYGFNINGADLRFTGSGSLTVQNVSGDAVICSNGSVRFDDETACPTLNITAGRYGVYALNVYLYQANLTVTSACTATMSDHNGYKAGGIVTEGTLQIGDGTMSAARNNVHLVASCAQGDNFAALFGSVINLPSRTTVITVPEGGAVGDLDFVGQTVYDGEGSRAYQVEITAQAAAPLEYGLWLNGTRLTEVNLNGGVSGLAFDPATGTLHVTGNVTLDQLSGVNGVDCAIYSALPDLILDVDEGCTLTLSGRDTGICALGNVHIPNGTLTITGAQTGVLCDGGSLYFDGEDTAKQPQVTITASKNAVSADSVYLWNVDLQATVTGAPGAGESAADFAAIRATGTASGNGVIRFGESGAAAWKNNTAVSASADNAQAIYAANGFTVSAALTIRQPTDCMPYTGDTTLRHLSDGIPAAAVRIAPKDANATTYALWIGEVQVTEDSRSDVLGDGTVIYVPGAEANTLYLKNATYVSEINELSTYVRYEESTPLIIRLEGENSFQNDVYFFNNAMTGIKCLTAELHIVGSGSLNMITRATGVECGNDHCLWFDDPVNRPAVTLQSSADALHAKSIYMDRAELHAVCRTGASTENANQRIWLYAAIRAEGNGADSGVLRIGKDGGTDNVLLDISISTLYEEKYLGKVFALYAKNDLILPDNETVVTPVGGGVLHETDKHTIIAPTNENADHILIEPGAAPAQVENYALWVNGVQVNRQNKNDLPGLNGSWFDSYSSTLHLTGEGTLQAAVVNSKGCGIYSELPELTIVLEEDCDLEVTPCGYGIYMAEDCDLHIRGGGRLHIPDARLGGIILNGDGDLYFDGQDPELRPFLELHSKQNGLKARDIHFWNVNLYLSVVPSWDNYPILANRDVEFGSDAVGEEWKNNAVVYAANRSRPAIIAKHDLTVSAEETVWLPNNYEIASYYGEKTFKDPNYRPTGSWEPAPAIFVSPKMELPNGEAPVGYDLWVNGIQVTSLNQDMIPGLGGSWYDPVTTTLHLSGKLYLDYTTNSPDGAVIDTRLNCLTIQLDYAQLYINTSAEPGEEEAVNAYGIYGSHDVIIQGDGRITVANADRTALYAGGTLTLGPGPAPLRSDYAYAAEYAEACEAWQSNLRLIPEVNVYSRTYGIRCANLKLESVKLNAVIYTNHNVGTASVAGYTVPNAAVLVTGSLDLGTSEGEFYRNAVTAPELSCSFKEDEGYAIYAGAIHENSAASRIIKPTSYTVQGGHYLVSSGSPVQVASIGTRQEAWYEITVEQPEDGIAGFISLDPLHADLRARAFDTVTVNTSVEPEYEITELLVENDDVALHQTLSTPTDTFIMPEADVTIRSEVALYGHEIFVDDALENGTVTADRSRAKQGELVTLTVTPAAGYELDRIIVTCENDDVISGALPEFTMPDMDVTVSAVFRKVVYSVTIDCGDNGTVSAVPNAASYGDTVALTIAPDARYQLDMLIVADEKGRRVDVENDEFIMPAADVTVTVRFAPILFNVSILENEHVRIEADTLSAQEGTTIYLTSYGEAYVVNAAAPIIVDGAGNPVAVTFVELLSAAQRRWSFTMPASDVTITPAYEYIYYEVSAYYYISHGTVTPQPSTAHAGETVTVTVVPDEGYALTGLTYHDRSLVNSEYPITQTNGVYSFTMPAGNVIIYATFGLVDYTVTVGQTVNGSVTAPATARFGDTVTLTVTPNEGYELDSLRYSCGDGEPVAIEASEGIYSFSMPASDVTVTATFGATPIPYVDALGNAMTPVTDYTRLTPETTELTEGWWVVPGDIANANRLTVSGSVNLILCDGATLNAASGICVGGSNSLTVWAQSHGDGCGKLIARTTNANHAAIGSNDYTVGTIVINGGEIDAVSSGYGAGIGGGQHSANGSITINNGKVTAQGGTNAAGIGGGRNNWSGRYSNLDYISITGGEVTATGNGGGAGIGGGGTSSSGAYGGAVVAITITGGKVTATSPSGYGIGPGINTGNTSLTGRITDSITFGWTETTDFIESSSNVSAEKLAFADGKWFLIDGQDVVATTSNIQSACKLIPLLDETLVPHLVRIDDSITHGTVEASAQTAVYQEVVTLTVTPDAGYALSSLTVTDENGDPVAVENGRFTMPVANVTVTASFTAIDYTITLTQAPNGTVTADVDLTHAHIGDVVTLTAEPATGYELTGCTVTSASGAIEVANGQFTMPACDVTVTATFALKDYQITVATAVGGTVSANGTTAHMGDTVTLTAEPAAGYELTGCTVTCASGAIEVDDGSFTMPAADVTVTPVFALKDYQIAFADVTGGTASANPNPAHMGDSITLTADPAAGYELTGYTVIGVNGAIEVNNGSFTMPDSDVTVTPTFTAVDYTVALVQATGGTVSISGDPAHAHVGDAFTLTATPATGYELTGYTVTGADLTIDPDSGSFTMPAADITVTPTFALKDYAITFANVIGGTASASPNPAHMGDTITLTAEAAAGYRFDGYTVTDGEGQTVDLSTENTFVMPASDVAVTPRFTAISYTIAVLPTSNGTVTVNKSTAQVNDEIVFTVTPAEGCKLQKLVVYDFSYNTYPVADNRLTMPAANLIVVATFTDAPYTITLAGMQHGSVTASQNTAAAGTRITLTVTPESGYVLGSLTVTDGDGAALPVQNNQFTMPASNVTVTASFLASDPTVVYFVGNSLTLAGDIGINFYVKLNDVPQSSAKIVFTWGKGQTKTMRFSELTADGSQRYKTFVQVAAAEMTDTVTAKLYDGETLVAEQQYSVAQYARYVLGASDAALLPLVDNDQQKADDLRALCKAMLIYGAKSQLQFKYNLYALADQGLAYTIADVGATGTTVFPDGFEDACGIRYYGSSLVLETKTSYRLYFTVTDQEKLDAMTVKLGGDTLTYGTRDNYVYFEIPDVAAAYVFRDYTLTFGDIEVTANAGEYVVNVLAGSDETLKDAVKALYWYSMAAKTYFGVE